MGASADRPDIAPAAPEETGALGDWAAPRLKAQADYISHGEILSGRSPDGRTWSDDLAATLARDFRACIDSGGAVLVARDGADVLGLCALHRSREAGQEIATIEDLLVDAAARGRGTGAALLEAAEALARGQGAQHILLESGIANEAAHRFFGRHGYRAVSKVFLKRGG